MTAFHLRVMTVAVDDRVARWRERAEHRYALRGTPVPQHPLRDRVAAVATVAVIAALALFAGSAPGAAG